MSEPSTPPKMSENSNEQRIETPNLSPVKPVKSTAVVKYSAVQSLATFEQLQCNTDLNLPPSNWLSSSAESYGLQNIWSQSSGFSSFRMAHTFPDCVGEVDVVSDAENIKKLLKIPYSSGVISMMVHRVENTLLLDDFDIHKYLLRQVESEWEWLKQFYYDYISQNLDDKEKRLSHKVNSRNALQQKNLISKFLYHSLVQNDQQQQNEKPPLPMKKPNPELPEPKQKDELPDPNYNHSFARNIVWTFENIQMLIGTDMPIFGGQTHPCISLKLRDTTKPINVLTGIDYWLDNLMCNVPEVIMCYHLDGIVQKYELIKTEDLPNLDNAKFSPRVIRDVAQNILSFLKNNATKAGHTYWLFKAKDDDVVKLYDLTSLCSDVSDDKAQNPFTIPVAMLLYRVARNMKYSPDYRQNHGTIRMLLRNCIDLLPKEKYPQIVTSAHYMLSDLYIPADTDPVSPGLADQSDEEDARSESSTTGDSEKSEETFEGVSAAIKSLTLTRIKDQLDHEVFKYKPPPICGTVEERCNAALEHISSGLECLVYFPTEAEAEKEKRKEEEEGASQNMAKPFEAIPMPYAPLKKDLENKPLDNTHSSSLKKKNAKHKKNKKSEKSMVKCEDDSPKALLCKPKNETLSMWQASNQTDNLSWNAQLKILLYKKGSLVFAVFAEKEYSNEQYGTSLRYIYDVLCCQEILKAFCGLDNEKLVSYVLGRAGDCCFKIVQDWQNIETHRQNYEAKTDTEKAIIREFYTKASSDEDGPGTLPQCFENLEMMLRASLKCYEKALPLESDEIIKNNFMQRLGNIHNELGVLYLNQAGSRYQEECGTNEKLSCSDAVMKILELSLKHLEDGVKAFEKVHNEANLALLHSNIGRWMRQRAHMHVKQYVEERNFYNKALASYQKALQVLGSRKTNLVIWDTVMWELSTTLFTMASLLQDYPAIGNKTEEELEREVVEILQKALKYCDTETPGHRQPVYQFRAGIIQHRLASLYHRIYRTMDPESDGTKPKTNLQLCRLHYEKAAKLFISLEQNIEYLTVQMERVALAEFQAQISTTFSGKLKFYQNGLEMILQCQSTVESLCERIKSTKDKSKVGNERMESKQEAEDEKQELEDEEKLIVLLEQRLQFILRSLTKLFLSKSNSSNKKEHEHLGNIYKQCYAKTLRQGTLPIFELATHIAKILQEIKHIMKDVQT